MLTTAVLCVAIDAVFSLVLRLRRVRRPRPAAVPAERLSAAAVQLVLADGTVPPAAAEQTVLALARAGWLRLTTLADGHPAVRSAGHLVWADPARQADGQPGPAGAEPLTEAEALVMERVEGRLSGVDAVPLAALGPGDGEEYAQWWRRFERAVEDEAYAAGLVWGRGEDGEFYAGAAVSLLLAALLCTGYLRVGFSWVWALLLGVVTVPLVMVPVHRLLHGPRLTPSGRQAARVRLGQDGSSAGGAAADGGAAFEVPGEPFPAGPSAVRPAGPGPLLPTELLPGPAGGEATAAPEPERGGRWGAGDRWGAGQRAADRWAWSSHGGQWRPVRVVSANRWGLTSQLLALTLLFAAVSTLAGFLCRGLPAAGIAVAAGAPAACWACVTALWLPAHRRLRSLPEREAMEATVVRLWSRTHHPDRGAPRTHYYCALDDGGSDRAWTFAVAEQKWRALAVGDLVRAECSLRRRRLDALTVLRSAAPPPAASGTAV